MKNRILVAFLGACVMIFMCSCGIDRNKVNEVKTNNILQKVEKANSTNKDEETAQRQEEQSLLKKSEQAAKEGKSQQNKITEIDGLVKLKDMDSSFIIDLRYATTSNFTGKKIYPVDVCVLRKETAEKLVKANEEFKKLGYKIKVWDAYRPPYVQQIFWNLVQDSRYVANPKTGGSRHNIGTAVDITLVDNLGKELVMPSGFDDFSIRAQRSNPNISEEAKKNSKLLTDVMVRVGFEPIETEWWHFDDSESSKYKIVDIKLERFEQ